MMEAPAAKQPNNSITIIDGYDIRPAVRAIMDMENWLLERLPPDQKLVLIVGEDHTNMMDMLFQQALIAAHLKQSEHINDRRFAFGYELGINSRKASSDDNALVRLYKAASTALFPHDPDGKHKIRDFIVSDFLTLRSTDTLSFGAIKHLLRYCARKGISVGFNDVANDLSMGIIDQEDPQARSIVSQHYPEMLDKVIFRAPFLGCHKGLEISNRAIVENALSHMQRTHSKIYIQQCGAYHLFGLDDQDNGTAAGTSLAALFSNSGCAVMPIATSFESGLERGILEASQHIKNTMVIDLPYVDESDMPFRELKKAAYRESHFSHG